MFRYKLIKYDLIIIMCMENEYVYFHPVFSYSSGLANQKIFKNVNSDNNIC